MAHRLKKLATSVAGSEKKRGRNEMPGRVARSSVGTPRAFASIASRSGARGDFGGRHVGDKAFGDAGDHWACLLPHSLIVSWC